MFAKVLYPTDFSDVSTKALEYVKKLKEAGTTEVIVAHIIDKRETVCVGPCAAWGNMTVSEAEANLRKTLESEARKKLNAIESKLTKAGLEVKIRLETGNPVQEILKIEDEEKVSAIVIGSHGKSNIKEVFLGSVSENVIRHCKKPILVVKR